MVIREGNVLKTDWYQIRTVSSRINNFFSKHRKRIIVNTANNLIRRVLQLSDVEFHKNKKKEIQNILFDNNFIKKKLTNQLFKVGQRT